jgi:hypothetical protein
MSEVTRDVKSFSRDPIAFAKREPLTAGALLTAGIVALAYTRGRRPDRSSVASAAIVAAVIVAAAQVAPKQVGWVALIGVLVLVWQNADAPSQLVAQISGGRLRF